MHPDLFTNNDTFQCHIMNAPLIKKFESAGKMFCLSCIPRKQLIHFIHLCCCMTGRGFRRLIQ